MHFILYFWDIRCACTCRSKVIQASDSSGAAVITSISGRICQGTEIEYKNMPTTIVLPHCIFALSARPAERGEMFDCIYLVAAQKMYALCIHANAHR
jgi:hypothetical protein